VQAGRVGQMRQEGSDRQTFMKAQRRQACRSGQAGNARQVRQDRAGTLSRSDQVRIKVGKQVTSGWEAEEAGRKGKRGGN
jgi:hypothetical protein